MLRRILMLLLAIALTSGGGLFAQEAPEGFASLFDGKTLDGWTQKNGTAAFEVVAGTIKGTTAPKSPNSFLCTDKEYGDFELHFETKVDPALNSGVQVRSASKEDYQNGRVHGPQVEIAETGFAGFIFSEGTGRKWISKDRTKHEHFKTGQWNKYRVIANGNRIKTWINGESTEDIEIPEVEATIGFIGLQVHAVPKNAGPFHVQWRNISIKELAIEKEDGAEPAEETNPNATGDHNGN